LLLPGNGTSLVTGHHARGENHHRSCWIKRGVVGWPFAGRGSCWMERELFVDHSLRRGGVLDETGNYLIIIPEGETREVSGPAS